MTNRLSPAALGAALLALTGCIDGSPVTPEVAPAPIPADAIVLQCIADVAAAEIRCEPAPPASPSGLHVDLLVGGQDKYVKLASSGTSFDGGTREFRSTVTVQNLSRHTMGTDGMTSPGVRIFFHSGPVAVTGSGSVVVQNADGVETFTATQQPYFLYPTTLEPLQISSGREWIFLLDPDVTSFSFMVYVATPMVDETAPLLGPVWTGGGGDSNWASAANWEGGRLPAADSAVTIPPDSMLGGAPNPVLAADDSVLHLRVGPASTLDLGGNRLVVGGNLDVTGAVSGGAVRLTGASALLGGDIPALEMEGNGRLQRPTVASLPVSVSGSLTVGEYPFSVSIP